MHYLGFIVIAFCLSTMMAGCGGNGKSDSAVPAFGPVAEDLLSLARQAELIVVGKVVAIQPGRVAGEGEGRLQFNDIQVQIDELLKGKPPAVLTVEQAAGPGEIIIGQGPPFRIGERAILFLRRGEKPRYITLPQGRYLLEAEQTHATEPGPVADRLNHQAETESLMAIKAAIK